jgi:flavin reductase (DIM6/NTAB) family NADH-FMN oxidoreductase RutF
VQVGSASIARSGWLAIAASCDAADMVKTVQPAILYFGTPVVLVSTLNEDGTA